MRAECGARNGRAGSLLMVSLVLVCTWALPARTSAAAEIEMRASAAGVQVPGRAEEVAREKPPASEPSPPAIDEIRVHAQRLEARLLDVPAAVSAIDREGIGRGRAELTLGEALARVPGVFTQGRTNFAQDLRLSIRGSGARANFGVRGVKLIVDDIPATLPDGQGQIDGILLSEIDRIEVLRGPSASLYGSASGGVVRIESAAGGARPGVEAKFGAGSHGYRAYDLAAAGRGGATHFRVALSHRESQGYRQHARMQRTQASGQLVWSIGAASDLRLSAGFDYAPIAEDPGGLRATEVAEDRRRAAPNNLLYDAGERVNQVRTGLRYRRDWGDGDETRIFAHYTWRGFENRLPIPLRPVGPSGEASNAGNVAFDRHFGGGGLQHVHVARVFGLESRSLVGVELDAQRDDRIRRDNLYGSRGPRRLDQRERVTSLHVFASEELALREDWALHLSLGWDRLFYRVSDHFLADGRDDSGARDFGQWSPAAALRYSPREGLSLYARVSTSFEPPTTTELADPAGGGGFNADLDPQRALGVEGGVKGLLPGRLRYELAVYHVRSRDELVPYEIPGQSGRSFFENAGRSTRTGVELALRMQPFEGLDVSLAYGFSRAEFTRFRSEHAVFDGHRVPGVPGHTLYTSLDYRHASGLWFGFELRYAGSFYADNANAVESDAYVVADLRIGWECDFGPLRVAPYLAADNLFAQRYADSVRLNAGFGRFFEPAPEREWRGGVNLRYAF